MSFNRKTTLPFRAHDVYAQREISTNRWRIEKGHGQAIAPVTLSFNIDIEVRSEGDRSVKIRLPRRTCTGANHNFIDAKHVVASFESILSDRALFDARLSTGETLTQRKNTCQELVLISGIVVAKWIPHGVVILRRSGAI